MPRKPACCTSSESAASSDEEASPPKRRRVLQPVATSSSSSEEEDDDDFIAPEGEAEVYDDDWQRVVKPAAEDVEEVEPFVPSDDDEEERPAVSLAWEPHAYFCVPCGGFLPEELFTYGGAKQGRCRRCDHPDTKWRPVVPRLRWPAARLPGYNTNCSPVHRVNWWYCQYCPGFCDNFADKQAVWDGRCTAHAASADFGRRQQIAFKYCRRCRRNRRLEDFNEDAGGNLAVLCKEHDGAEEEEEDEAVL